MTDDHRSGRQRRYLNAPQVFLFLFVRHRLGSERAARCGFVLIRVRDIPCHIQQTRSSSEEARDVGPELTLELHVDSAEDESDNSADASNTVPTHQHRSVRLACVHNRHE